ncbi:hypothetical protein G9A89_007702 [Geosiphon pyriformis]|nr:hypothetical protein G9A89_007702 [Geosiphon pyriformis]
MFCHFAQTSFIHDSFKKLQNFRTEIVAINPAIVFNSQDFTSLSENTLSSILTRDDLNIEESKIWEKIAEWGVAKLDQNIQMTNFNAFEGSIERLLLLIRFFNIYSVDFYHKSRRIHSSHQLCDNKGATVSVIKVKGTDQLIGGYNPQSCHSHNQRLDGEGSFIFSLRDGKAGNVQLCKFIEGYRLYGDLEYGTYFGGCFYDKITDYEDAIMPGSENQRIRFFGEEYKVFQTIKK